LLPSVKNDLPEDEVISAITDTTCTDDTVVNVQEVQLILANLENGKSAGPDLLPGESLKYASTKVAILLSCCFTAMFVHGFLPLEMMDSMIVPIVKNKCGDVSDKNNYRPVALANITSKVFELVMLNRLEDHLWTSDNQFGFKKKSSTDLCIYTLREFIEFFKAHNTSVFVTFLDASKNI
jgi:hypothetical protein